MLLQSPLLKKKKMFFSKRGHVMWFYLCRIDFTWLVKTGENIFRRRSGQQLCWKIRFDCFDFIDCLNLRIEGSLDSGTFWSTNIKLDAPTLSIWLRMSMNSDIIIGKRICCEHGKKILNTLAHCVCPLSNREQFPIEAIKEK